MRRRHIGIVFQFFNLLEGMSVLENVTLPAVIAGTRGSRPRVVPRPPRPARPRRQGRERARSALRRATPAPGYRPALANEPTLLLADEPTGALDSDGGLEVLELFRRLHAGGQTILLVTHDDDVAAAADRIVRMRDGRIEDDGRTADRRPTARPSSRGNHGVSVQIAGMTETATRRAVTAGARPPASAARAAAWSSTAAPRRRAPRSRPCARGVPPSTPRPSG